MCYFYIQLQCDRLNTILFLVTTIVYCCNKKLLKIVVKQLQQYGKHNVYASSLYIERTHHLREIYDVWFGDSLMDFPYDRTTYYKEL